MLNGQCLCGSVQFQLALNNIELIYQCHCSLCRKQSGTHANHASMLKVENFAWTMGQDHIKTYKKTQDLHHHFVKIVAHLSLTESGNIPICGFHSV